jgi:hypothetical protein
MIALIFEGNPMIGSIFAGNPMIGSIFEQIKYSEFYLQ